MGQAASRTQPSRLHVHPLCRGFAVLVWDSDEAVRAQHVQIGVDGKLSRRARCGCSVELTTRQVRNLLLVALEQADNGQTLAVSSLHGCVLACCSERPHPPAAEFDSLGVLAGVERRSQTRLLRFFVETCPAVASLATDPRWIAACRGLIAALAGRLGALRACCSVVNGLRLYEGLVPPALGGPASAVLITDGGLKRPAAAHLSAGIIGGQRRLLHVIVEEQTSGAPATAVVFAGDAAIIRTLPAATPASSPSVLSFLRQRSPACDVRRHLLYDALAALSPVEPKAAELLRELRLLVPEVVIGRCKERPQPFAGIDHVIASAAGLFIRGWLDTSHGLAEAIEVESGSERHRLPVADLVSFPLAEPAASAVGFVAGVAVANPEAPCRIRLGLRSGLTIDLATGPETLDAGQACERILASLPASIAANPAIRVIEPAVQALHLGAARTLTPIAAATVGPLPAADPLVSIIVPLGRYAEPVRCRVARAAIATDTARCEFVYVLDRPNDFASAEQLLSDLYQCSGVGGRLLLMPPASNPASPLNLGAAAARGRYLLFLNAGTVPETADWLAPLLARLAQLAEPGAAAGTVVHPDQSLHQLGGDIGEDPLGRWGPHWRAAGYPRAAIADAEPLPLLLAVPGLLVEKICFDRFGGFDPSYFDPFFRDADFSLRLLENGGRLALARSSVFIEFDEAEPLRQPGRELAQELDRRRFERRWRGRIESLCTAPKLPHVGPTTGSSGGLRPSSSDGRRAA